MVLLALGLLALKALRLADLVVNRPYVVAARRLHHGALSDELALDLEEADNCPECLPLHNQAKKGRRALSDIRGMALFRNSLLLKGLLKLTNIPLNLGIFGAR